MRKQILQRTSPRPSSHRGKPLPPNTPNSNKATSEREMRPSHHLESGLQQMHVHRLQHRVLHQEGLRRSGDANHAGTDDSSGSDAGAAAAANAADHQSHQTDHRSQMQAEGKMGRRVLDMSLLGRRTSHLRWSYVQTRRRWRRRGRKRRRWK